MVFPFFIFHTKFHSLFQYIYVEPYFSPCVSSPGEILRKANIVDVQTFGENPLFAVASLCLFLVPALCFYAAFVCCSVQC